MFQPVPQNNRMAVGLMVIFTVFLAGTTLLAKAIGTGVFGPPLHPLQVSWGRFLFAFVAISAIFAQRGEPIRHPAWTLHFGRSFCGWGGVSLTFASVAYIPLSDATAISFLSPVFAMLLAIPILGETVGRVRWGAAGIALVGMVILLRPGPESFQPAAMLALAAAVAMGIEMIFIKRLSGREPWRQILLVNNTIGVSVATLAMLPVWQAPTAAQWAALAGIGVIMLSAQVCFVNAMARAEASLVAPFSYGTLVFAALYDLMFFGVLPDTVSILGAAVIVAGAALLAWREAMRRSDNAAAANDAESAGPLASAPSVTSIED
ncbi:DMT family transporter [Pseudoruegeria sp. HB172150]|uniref:DMT family transporter n=1 Tax=Pseudoruegeria sp. HB172150 TaxID=2721164 RepID=UPI001551A331|nr:DMT family transporter [Pseudoruegeria sp. HB172150]